MNNTRTYNTLPDELRRKDLSLTLFKSKLLQYYHDAVKNVYDINDPRSLGHGNPRA